MPKKTVVGSEATNQVDKLAGSTSRLESSVSGMSNKVQSAFGNIKTAAKGLQDSIQQMATSIAGITIGGAVSGIAWMDSAKTKLYNEQIKEAVENNKKLGLTYEQLTKFSAEQAAAGEGTKQDTAKELYAVLTAGSKYTGKGQKGLEAADAITDFYFKHQEMMQEQGIGSTEQMVQRAIMTQGKMSGRFGVKFATAMGVSPDDASMKSAKARMKYFMEQGATVNMKAELDKRPWEQLQINIDKLKYSIGDSIAGPMAYLTGVVARLAEILREIPGVPALIGMLGAGLAIASAFSLVIGVLTPLYNLMKALNIITAIQTTLRTTNAVATITDASAHAMLTGAMEGEFVATELTTAAQNMSFAARIRLIGATLWDTAARYANSVANFLGISSLLGLAAAETTAAGGATLLGTSLNLAVAPLWLIIGAGLVLVGVFTAILAKAGVLEPLLKGISKINFGKVWSEFVSGDFGGAWHQLTKGFNLPSFSEALKNFFSGTSFFSVVTRLLGVPLYKIIDFMSSILDVVKKIKDFVDWIIGLFYKYIWTPLKGIWDYAKSVAEYLVGGSALSGEELKAAWTSAIKSSNNIGLTGASQEKIDAIWDVITGNKVLTQQEKNKLQITDPELADAKSAYEKLKNPTGVLNQGVSGFADNVVSGIKSGLDDATKVAADKTNEALTSGSGSGFASADWSVLSPVKYAWNALEGIYHAVTKNALGGEVTKSGLAIVDEGEPIIPAEINRSSNLIDLLETLASGNISNSKSSNIVINFDYTATGTGTGNGMYLDQFAFERKVKEIIGKCTRTYGSY